MQERKNSKNYVRLGKSVAGGKDGIRLESNSENSISVRKEIYEACLTNSSTGRNGVPQVIVVPRIGRYHLKARGRERGIRSACEMYLGYEPGKRSEYRSGFRVKSRGRAYGSSRSMRRG